MSSKEVNPYTAHKNLSPLEQDVLWEYAKLSDKIKRISNLSKLTADSPNEDLLQLLRSVEKQMGLVLTLYKASVWAVVQEQQAQAEDASHLQQQDQSADWQYAQQ